MNRIEEISNLIDICISRLNLLIHQIKFANYEEFISKLKVYQNKILTNNEIDVDWFNPNFLSVKSTHEELYDLKNLKDIELFNAYIRLRNLNTANPQDQISSSITHYEPLIQSGELKLKKLGFELHNKTEYRIDFINNDNVVVTIVYQRYDPPEVYIKREIDEKYLRLGPMLELAINKTKEIWDNHCGENGHYFNYSSFDYFEELLKSIYVNLNKKETFVEYYNDEINKLYEQ